MGRGGNRRQGDTRHETRDWETGEDEVEAEMGALRQELVFIGVELAREEMIAQLDAALLTDAELAQGAAKWRKYCDDLPA
ncbi:MAG: GTP-binding protein [Caldilineaceae bacterium]